MTNVEKLNQQLFGERTRLYAALDGAAVPDLPLKLHEMRPPHVCLYRGELEPDLAWVAPYLVHLVPDTAFTNWLLAEGWGKHWGIFAHNTGSMVETRKHFRRFLTVYAEDGKPLLFRYYDPRVLTKFLPTCSDDELKAFFGKVTTYFAESDDAKSLTSFRLKAGVIEQSSIELEAAR